MIPRNVRQRHATQVKLESDVAGRHRAAGPRGGGRVHGRVCNLVSDRRWVVQRQRNVMFNVSRQVVRSVERAIKSRVTNIYGRDMGGHPSLASALLLPYLLTYLLTARRVCTEA